MSPYQPAASRYREVEVTTANPVQLVVMLYDGAIAALKEAQEHIRKNNIAARTRCANRAVGIISELQASLNFRYGGTIALSLDQLYGYMKQLVFQANVEQRCEPLAEVAGLLENLRAAWCTVAAETCGALAQAGIPETVGEIQPAGINISG